MNEIDISGHLNNESIVILINNDDQNDKQLTQRGIE